MRKCFPLRCVIIGSVAPSVVSSSHHRSQCGAGVPPVCAMYSGSWTPVAWCEDWSWMCTRILEYHSSGTLLVCPVGRVGRARIHKDGSPHRSEWPSCTWGGRWWVAWCERCWLASTCWCRHTLCVYLQPQLKEKYVQALWSFFLSLSVRPPRPGKKYSMLEHRVELNSK